jgi:CRISPR-associated protein Csb2
MNSYLAIHVRLHDGRYHGAGDWPPSPARLYQALIAGVGLGGPIPESTVSAFQWLESLPAPEIIVPQYQTTTGYTNYVPNNDLDAKKGDPGQIGGIRSGKTIRACLFDDALPLHYLWTLPSDDKFETHAREIIETADRLYQFGRGVDMAWAFGEFLDESQVVELRERDGFIKFSPDAGPRGLSLPTPVAGSYQSLKNRYQAGAKRFTIARSGKSITKTFIQPPQPRFHSTSYNSPPAVLLFELRRDDEESAPHSAPLESIAALTATIRDSVLERLHSGLSQKSAEIDRCLLGKNPDGSHAGTSKDRITILPLPSIGHHHADMLIRRAAVFASTNCSISIPDLRWAFSNLKLCRFETAVVLLPASDASMLSHYAEAGEVRTWRTITPIALPDAAARRRIAPERKLQEAKAAHEKAEEESQAVAAVMQALRHAGYREGGANVTRIQRVPFQAHGKRVEDFAPGSRFAKERLWHVEIEFSKALRGPLILGDGRFCGLGLFAPVRETRA